VERGAAWPCLALLQEKSLLEERLTAARKSMVERIGAALAQFDPKTRRFLLTIKRSCFNQREIGMHREKAKWAELLRISSGLAESIVILENQLRERESSFNSVYESELLRERRHVIDLTQDRRFLRGIAIGRAGLVQKIRAQASSPATMRPLKPAKWEHSLLRFVTRAATKLSANSTLTTYALGSVQDQPSFRGFRFADSPQRETSLVRANRPELEKLQALLIRHPAVRERCLIAWNPTFEELEPGRYRFLRGGHWDLDTGSTEFRFVQSARVTVTLSNPVLPTVRQALGKGAVRVLPPEPEGRRGECPSPISASSQGWRTKPAPKACPTQRTSRPQRRSAKKRRLGRDCRKCQIFEYRRRSTKLPLHPTFRSLSHSLSIENSGEAFVEEKSARKGCQPIFGAPVCAGSTGSAGASTRAPP
jgi:hypothetical protein